MSTASIYAVITHKPGYMHDVEIFHANGIRMRGYGQVYYTRWGARLGAKRWLKRAIKDNATDTSREEVRL